MPKGGEVLEFAQMVGAKEPEEGTEFYMKFRPRNFFFLKGTILHVKISRSPRPFWGVGEESLDSLDSFDYFLVLLTSDTEGWLFSKKEVKANISRDKWRLGKDGDYKINMPLPDQNFFFSPERFLKRVEQYDR